MLDYLAAAMVQLQQFLFRFVGCSALVLFGVFSTSGQTNECPCQTYPEVSYGHVARPITRFVPFKQLERFMPWPWVDSAAIYQLRTVRTTVRNGYRSGWLVSEHPLWLVHPDSTFHLNLTPCPNTGPFEHSPEHRYLLYYSVGYHHYIKQRLRGFEVETFDPTTESLFRLACQYYRKDDITLLANYLAMYDEVVGESEVPDTPYVQEVFDTLSRRYDVHLHWKDYRDVSHAGYYEGMARDAVNQGLDVKTFLLKEYIRAGVPGVHAPTQREMVRMGVCLAEGDNYYRLMERFLERIVYPQVSATFRETEQVGIGISTDVLSDEPYCLQDGPDSLFTFRAHVSKLRYESRKGFAPQISRCCFPRCFVAGTGVELQWTQAELHSQPTNVRQEWGGDSLATEASLRLTAFTGLQVDTATVLVPYGRKVLMSAPSQIWANHQLVAGRVAFELAKMPRPGKNKVKLQMGDRTVRVNIDRLQEECEAQGLRIHPTVEVHPDGSGTVRPTRRGCGLGRAKRAAILFLREIHHSTTVVYLRPQMPKWRNW